jgi:tight adherence protein B
MIRSGFVRLALVTTLAAAMLLTGAASASAKPTGRIDVQRTATGMSIVLTASDQDAAPGTPAPRIDQKSIDVGIQPNSRGAFLPVETEKVDAATAGTAPAQSVMLVIDDSGSMDPDDSATSRKAATDFLDEVMPNGVRVGLVVFATKSVVVSAPTTDRRKLTPAIARLGNAPLNDPDRASTNLYKAVDDALRRLPKTGARSLVLLSDGRDDTGTDAVRDAEPVLNAIKRANVPLKVVALGDLIDKSTLRQFVKAVDGGRYISADVGTDQLASGFAATANEITNRVVVTVTVPPELLDAQGVVSVTAMADGQQIRGQSQSFFSSRKAAPKPTATINAAPQVVTSNTRFDAVDTTPVLIAALVALFLALCVISGSALGLVGRSPSDETQILRRLSVYTLSGNEPRQVSTETATTRLGDNVLARSAVDLVGRVVRRGKFDASIDSRLDAAGLPLRTAEWTLLHVGTAVGAALTFLLISGYHLLPMILGLVIGIVAPWMFLTIRRSRRESAFLAQLPDTLQLVAGSLQAGYSLPQAIDSVVREARPPISAEFSRALIETRLGMPAEDTLEAIATRMSSRDFSWIVMAIRIQREVGGNLAELLSSVAGTLRERERLRRQVSALSAEGRLSGWILGLLPVVFTVFLALANPEYLGQLNNRLGAILLVIAGILLAVGVFWMSRVVRVEV